MRNAFWLGMTGAEQSLGESLAPVAFMLVDKQLRVRRNVHHFNASYLYIASNLLLLVCMLESYLLQINAVFRAVECRC